MFRAQRPFCPRSASRQSPEDPSMKEAEPAAFVITDTVGGMTAR